MKVDPLQPRHPMMHGNGARVTEKNEALLTDLYQLTMAQAYLSEGMNEDAAFSLFVRRLPPERNFLLACGLQQVLDYLESLRFDPAALEYIGSLPGIRTGFLDWLERFRFTGSVYAVPEGTPVFADEPIVEVVAPIAQAQLVETYLMNQVHFQTVVASKASRVVMAARGAPVIDFGLRRMHGTDAGLKSARAFHIAGVSATSNVLAGRSFGLPVSGTMGHSYVQAHDDEKTAFRAFLRDFPEAVLLVDTYDTLRAVDLVIQLAAEQGDDFRARGIRLDSGDLGALAVEARARFDAVGLHRLKIFASGGLDEYEISKLMDADAPIDGFGVGTGMGVSSDAPSLDLAYKLTEYAGHGRLKTSPGKPILPGRKQVYRVERAGRAIRDVICRWDEEAAGRPLLRAVMREGERLVSVAESIDDARRRASEELDRLPEPVRRLERALPAYAVEVSPSLRALQQSVIAKHA